MDRVMKKLALERAVVVFTLSSYCMCHTVMRLMADLGVNALVHELDSDPSPQGQGDGEGTAQDIRRQGPSRPRLLHWR